MSYYNGTYEVVAEALRYLADNERPKGGQQRFNAEHLFQLADEMGQISAENAQLRERNKQLVANWKDDADVIGSLHEDLADFRARVEAEFEGLRAMITEGICVPDSYSQPSVDMEIEKWIIEIGAARERLMGGKL